MERLVSIAVIFLLCISTVKVERTEKCGVVDFDPSLVYLENLQMDTYYAYGELPIPPCTNVTLRYVNFCYNFVYPSQQPRTESVGQLFILQGRMEFDYYIRAFRDLRTDISICEGNLFNNEGFNLCCISQSLNYDGFKITQGTIANHTFALRVPANMDYSISLGYNNTQNKTVLGFLPDSITMTINSLVGRMQLLTPLLLPLISFTEMARFQDEGSPSLPPSTEDTTLSICPDCTNPAGTTANFETPAATGTITTTEGSANLSTVDVTSGKVPITVNPGIHQVLDINSVYKTAVYVLASLSAILIILSICFLLVISWLIMIRKNNKLTCKSVAEGQGESFPAAHSVCTERHQGDEKAAHLVARHLENYNLLNHKQFLTDMLDIPQHLEGYEKLQCKGITMNGNTAYKDAHDMIRFKTKRNPVEKSENGLKTHRNVQETPAISISNNTAYDYTMGTGKECSTDTIMEYCDSDLYVLPSLRHQKEPPQENLMGTGMASYNPTHVAKQQPCDAHLANYFIPKAHGSSSPSTQQSAGLDNIPTPSLTQPATQPSSIPRWDLITKPEMLTNGVQQGKMPSSENNGRSRVLEVNKSSSMKSNNLYNMTVLPAN